MTLDELLDVVDSSVSIILLELPEYDEYEYKDTRRIPKEGLNRRVVKVEPFGKYKLYITIR